jgi:hypothetical protein
VAPRPGVQTRHAATLTAFILASAVTASGSRLGAYAAVLGPVLLLAYYWSEAAFGPSQPSGGPLRMAIGFTLICGALVCFAVALLRTGADAVGDQSRMARVGRWLGYLTIGLLALGATLWWPILFIWPEYGPLAGAPVALGLLSLVGMWLLAGLRAARNTAVPGWARALPLSLLAVVFLIFYMTGSASASPLVVVVLIIFALGWLLLAYAIVRSPGLVVAVPSPDGPTGH